MREPSPAKSRSERRRLWRTFLRNRASVFGLVLAVLVTIVSVAAPLFTAHDPLIQEARSRLQPPDRMHILGRDTYGRDLYARVLFAGRISLLVGVCSVLLGGVVGCALGLCAGALMSLNARGELRMVVGYVPPVAIPWTIIWTGTAAVMAMRIVFRSRTSPTSITSGSSRNAEISA